MGLLHIAHAHMSMLLDLRSVEMMFCWPQEGTWQEAARRLAALCQVGRMVQASEGQASGQLLAPRHHSFLLATSD